MRRWGVALLFAWTSGNLVACIDDPPHSRTARPERERPGGGGLAELTVPIEAIRGAAVVFVWSAECGASTGFEPIVKDYANRHSERIRFLAVNARNTRRAFPYTDMTPSLLFVRDGLVVDMIRGASSDAREAEKYDRLEIRGLLVRNGVIDDPGGRYPHPISPGARTVLHYYMPAGLSSGDMRGYELSNLDLKGALIAGSTLDGADLRGSDMSGSFFLNTSLLGAKTDGANFHGVTWTACVCPDGAKSDETGATCDGHLGPPLSRGSTDGIGHTP